MNKKIYVVLIVTLLICSCGRNKPKETGPPKLVTITGRAYYAGSEPNASIALNTFNGKVRVLVVRTSELKKLMALENRIITVKGYIDPVVNYPQISIIVKEYKEVEASTISGKLIRSGIGELANYVLQTPEKSYTLVAERIIQINDLLKKEVYADGYVFDVENSGAHIYIQSVRSKEKKPKEY